MDELFETDDDVPVPEGGLLRMLPIINRRGLHARASAKFVQTVERYHAAVTVTRAGETVGGRSIMGLLTLGAAMGTRPGCRAVPRRH
jgi:phosphocarrier protein